MTKKPREKKPVPKLNLSPLTGIGGGLRDILVSAATHPTTAALAVMGLTVIGQFATGAYSDQKRMKSANLANVHGQLNGLYDGAQKLAIACAVVPVAVGAINLAQSALQKPSIPGKT